MCEVTWLGQQSQGPDIMKTGWPVPRIPQKGSLKGSRGEQVQAQPKLGGR